MKRIRKDEIQSTVMYYLRKRQFIAKDVESLGRKDLKTRQSMTELAVHGSVACESGETSVVCYSSVSGDATQCDQQFSRLKHFIGDAVEPFRSELVDVLYPMFVHIYLELIGNGQKIPAQKFYSRHHGLFTEEESCKPTISALSQVLTSYDVNKHETVKAFKRNKYKVTLSDDALEYLLRYLKSEDNTLLLQIFNLHIQIKVSQSTMEEHVPNCDLPPLGPDARHQLSPPPVADTGGSTSKSSLQALEQSIQQVRDGPPCMPSVCLYTFHATANSLSTASLSPDLSMLAGGFEDSSIKVWSLSPRKFHRNPTDVQRIRLACDIPDPEPEENRADNVTLRGHSGSVYDAQFTHDSKHLLSISEDTSVRLWDMNTFINTVVYRAHDYPIWSLDISPLSIYFVTGSKDATARLWSFDRTYPLRVFAGHNSDVDCVKFHPNSNYIATASVDRTVRLWNVQDAKLARVLRGHQGSVFALAFSPDGHYLASAGEDRRIRIWDVAAGTLYKELKGHTDSVYSLCFNKLGSMLASGGMDNVTRIWDVRMTTINTVPTEGYSSAEMIGAFPSKSSNILHMRYSTYNLLTAVAVYS
ncbi:PREDICTED: TAF5-like RNA polymerase II p300/CBP-associated factor-associated factor 65 kDa subunit 5L [Priapulus caudatus]|uniref:TAF5-like RNA polymerase II p300/CBP-associated factor-associated factor 65 kDa subunit 5L n=1 Tax=Priapulus caudatus TaxID=37621 RepID=A0ABM1F9R0_PRICU|nr:PREDICTED: TAF5-like RNA polymerase II p300/CBP-associated factor-associated factor 65 kDa subunit 5L [Priapulus caudatus]